MSETKTEIALMGDVMLGRGVNHSLELNVKFPHEIWGDFLPDLFRADVRIINLECAITSHRQPWTKSPKEFFFRVGPVGVNALQAARISACCLANNHVLDFDETGLLDTLRHLDEVGIAHAGAGRNLAEARQPAMIFTKDKKAAHIALLSATDNQPEFAATPDNPGTHYFPVDLDVATLAWLDESVALARDKGAEIVVLSMHWGPNMVERPPAVFRRFAQAAIDRGVDVFHGHSSHLFQGLEIYRDKPIFYDTGDFIDDYEIDRKLRNDWSFLFKVFFEGSRFVRLQLIPASLSYAQVKKATSFEKIMIIEKMRRLCGELGTQLRETEAGLELVQPYARKAA